MKLNCSTNNKKIHFVFTDIVLHLDENSRPVVRENQYDEDIEELLSYWRKNINDFIETDDANSIINTLLSEIEEKQQ